MARRLLAALIGVVVLIALAAVLAPGQFDAAVGSAADIVEQTPEPFIIGVTTLVLSVVSVLTLVYVLRGYYWLWLKIEGPFTRFWGALVPESPILRFGLGITVMALLFLVGPLVVLAELDLLGNDQDPIEGNDTGDDGTGTGEDMNTTSNDGASTGGDVNSTESGGSGEQAGDNVGTG